MTFDWHPEPELLDLRAATAREALEELGTDAWALALDYLFDEAMRRPVGPDSYPELRTRLFGDEGTPSDAPAQPAAASDVLEEIRLRLLPLMFNSQHPSAFSYFTPPPLAMSVVGEMLGQWFHQGVDVFHAGPAAALLEEEVTTWLRDLVGIGPEGWGVLTSGGVMANIMAMTVLRDRHLSKLLGIDGSPRGAQLEDVRVYVSDQAHFSIGRALDMLGFPSGTLAVVESDDRYCLQAGPVAQAIERDRRAGLLPAGIAAVSGSTNTGSVDDVPGLAALARQQECWLHVDAAYGGAARCSERDAVRVPGLELADSVTIDPHKWFFQAYDIGALVVRRRDDLRGTFHRAPEYYRSALPETEPLNWLEYSMEGTRRLRALKLWCSWKHVGTSGFGRMVEHDDDVAAALASAIDEADDFEAAVARPDLSVVCFRHLPSWATGEGGSAGSANGAAAAALDAHQDRLQRVLEVSGKGWVSTTRLRGRTYLRAGVMNPMSEVSDVLALLADLRSLAEGLDE